MTRTDLTLDGVGTRVLASYLKGLAVLRLVSEQEDGDPEASAWWDDEGGFHLVSVLDATALMTFFRDAYRPTPIVTPWNGGSGFFPKDQKAGISAIETSDLPRLAAYRAVIAGCRSLLAEIGLGEKPEKDVKQRLLKLARSRLPDEALPWLDAAYAVGDEARFPALLGTGGNDGRLDFANNFMQRVAELLLEGDPEVRRSSEARLGTALFARNGSGTFEDVAIGQFSPAFSGGPNMSTGIDGPRRVNPWDFVLALEGATLFAGATVRRLDAPTTGSSFPFHVRASAAGHGTAAVAEEESARSEIWLPVWSQPATLAELRVLFAEGRLDLGSRRSRTGLEAAQAVVSLGIDRGIDRFERIGILRRNGLAYFATWLGTLWARHVEGVDLIRELDDHVDSVRAKASALIRPAVRRFDEAVYALARGSGSLVGVLAALGRVERALNRSPKSREAVRCQPPLGARWWQALDEESRRGGRRAPELELAAAFSSWQIRERLQPVVPGGFRWSASEVPWRVADPLEGVAGIAVEMLLRSENATGSLAGGGCAVVSGGSLASLAAGRIDRELFADLLFGLALLPQPVGLSPARHGQPPALPPWLLLLRAVTSPRFLAEECGLPKHPSPRIIPALLARLRAGNAQGAVELASRRAVGSGLALKAPIAAAGCRHDDPVAVACALLVPLEPAFEKRLVSSIFVDSDRQNRTQEGEPADD